MVFPRLRQDQYLSAFLLAVMIVVGGTRSEITIQEILTAKPAAELVRAAPVPVFTSNASTIDSTATIIEQPEVSAAGALVIDLPSASVLFEKNARHYYHPASTAKLMTALIARQVFPLDHSLTVKEEAYTSGTTVGLTPGMVVTVEDALKALLIHSGNDAAFLLANNFAGGYEAFVRQMNEQAGALHLAQTSYTNPSGLDETNQVTTPFDLSILTREVLRDEFLAATVASATASVTDQLSQEKFTIYSTNRLLTQDSRYRGVKTGTTELAGEVLASRYVDGERDLLIVVMASQDRYRDTASLVQWVVTHYQWQDPKGG